MEVQGSPWRPWNGVNEPEEIVIGAHKTYPRNYSAATEVMLLRSKQLACEHRSISGRRFSPSPGISMERSDDLKYVCACRLGNSKDPQKRIGHGWDIKSHQQKGPNKTRNII